MKALINEEYETKQTRRVLYEAYDKYQNEIRRATEAEGRALEAAQRYRVLNDAKVRAEAESGRLREELRMYKLQLENAQSKIHQVQSILNIDQMTLRLLPLVFRILLGNLMRRG